MHQAHTRSTVSPTRRWAAPDPRRRISDSCVGRGERDVTTQRHVASATNRHTADLGYGRLVAVPERHPGTVASRHKLKIGVRIPRHRLAADGGTAFRLFGKFLQVVTGTERLSAVQQYHLTRKSSQILLFNKMSTNWLRQAKCRVTKIRPKPSDATCDFMYLFILPIFSSMRIARQIGALSVPNHVFPCTEVPLGVLLILDH